MNYFAKFEKFLPRSIIIPSFMTIGSQMPELDWGGGFFAPQYKINSQNTPYKLGLKLQEYNFHIEQCPARNTQTLTPCLEFHFDRQSSKPLLLWTFLPLTSFVNNNLRGPLLQPIVTYLETGTLSEDSSESGKILASSSEYFM